MLKKWVSNLLLTTTVCVTTTLPLSFFNQKWHIIGGNNVDTNKYRWFATIRDIKEPVNSLPIGGGVLIAPEWVLTAAHLFKSSWNNGYEPHLKITFNQNDLDNSDQLTTIYAKKILRAPDASQGNDLALIKLDKPVENIFPIQISEDEPILDKTAITMGYGKTNYNPDSIPTKLQELTLPLINYQENLTYLQSIGYQYNQYDIIAGTIGGIEKFPTPGDSGGPLIQLIKNRFTVIGVFKSGIVNHEIIQDQHPTLFTSIYKNKEWINKNIERDNEFINQKLAIQKYFLQSFDYDHHGFTTNTTRREVRDFVEFEIRKIFNKPFKLTIINDQGTVTDNSSSIEDGDWFDFELTSFWFKTKFRYMAKNVGNKTNIRKKIQQIISKFANEIDVTEHKLSTDSLRGDAFLFVNDVISKILNVEYHLKMKGFNPDKFVINTALPQYVWKGDWFDFTLQVAGFETKEFRFYAKNVAGKKWSINFLNRVQDYFRNPVFFNEHRLTTFNTYNDSKNWVNQILKKIGNTENFWLNLVGIKNSHVNMTNTNQQIGHGKLVKFNLALSDENGDFDVKFKNIGQDGDQGMLWDIIDYWNDNFKSGNFFNTQSDELELWNLIYLNLNSKFHQIHFKLRLLNYQLFQPLLRWATYYFELEIGEYEHRFSFNVGKLKDAPSIAYNLKTFFDQEFLFHEHQLTTKNIREDARKLALSWIKKITDKNATLILNNFDETSNIINNSSLVSNGDWFDFKIKINKEEIDLRFKVKNVQNRPGSGYLLDVDDIFSFLINTHSYHFIRSTLNYYDIRKFISNIIEEIFVSFQATFSLTIDYHNLEESIGRGNKTFNFKIKIDNVTKAFAVSFWDIPKW